jgi:hypothetical protein
MKALQPVAKLFLCAGAIEARDAIAIFHRWIQQQRLGSLLLIDVADYSHVADGAMVLLVAHEGQLSIDREWIDGASTRLGIMWRARRGEPTGGEGLLAAAKMALTAAAALEADAPGTVRFAAQEILLGFDDRLNAPNDAQTFAALRAELDMVAHQLYGHATMAQGEDAKSGFRVTLRGAVTSVRELLLRV